MKHLAAGLFFLLAATSPALATATISCQSDAGASVYIKAGLGPELSIIGVDIVTGDQHWSTYAIEAEPLEILQSFSDGDSIQIDISDPNFEQIIAKIRLFAADEGPDYALAGVLHILHVGAYAIICEGL